MRISAKIFVPLIGCEEIDRWDFSDERERESDQPLFVTRGRELSIVEIWVQINVLHPLVLSGARSEECSVGCAESEWG